MIKFLWLILLILQPFAAHANDSFRIAVAANFRSTLEIILEQYLAAQPDVSIAFSSGSSGSLYQQILHGAPYQLFLSADSRYPKQL
jgi:molybdate transport system substrate-binding protein